MNLTLRVWRQSGTGDKGRFEEYDAPDVESHMSFLEMLDMVNERLTLDGIEPIAFDHDCREGICGTCGLMIDGRPHGPWDRHNWGCRRSPRTWGCISQKVRPVGRSGYPWYRERRWPLVFYPP